MDTSDDHNNSLFGWVIFALSVMYGIWIVLAFAIAVPPPSYTFPRAGIAVAGIFVGVFQIKQKNIYLVLGAVSFLGGMLLGSGFS